jgi:hypothetical protein
VWWLYIYNLYVDAVVLLAGTYLYTCVTGQGTDYELPEDDTKVSKHVAV